MEAYGYQQQQPDYPQPTPVVYYAPGFGSGQPPRIYPKSSKEKAWPTAKGMAIADIAISSVMSAAWLTVSIFVYPHAFAGLLLVYVGSIIGSILILTQPKKKWPSIFWVFWNIFRILAELVVPIVCGVFWLAYLSSPERPSHSVEGDSAVFATAFTVWSLYEIGMLSMYITFAIFIGRYWCSFNAPNDRPGMQFQPPPAAPAGQPLYVQQPPQYQYQQYQNPPPPLY